MKIMKEHIPAHTRVTTLYTFDELPDEVRDKLRLANGVANCEVWEGEYRATLKALERLTGINCKDWSVSEDRYDYTLRLDGDTVENAIEEDIRREYYDYAWMNLSGRRAMAKCWSEFGGTLMESKTYYSEDYRNNHKTRKSRISHYLEGACPFTGYCADNDALTPLWDMMRGKFAADKYKTIADVLQDCFDNFFRCWRADLEYGYSEESTKESLDSEYFTVDGEPVAIPKGATLEDLPEEEEVA